MIKGICYTNLDEYRNTEFPRTFVAVPRIGEKICPNTGGNMSLSLRVVSVTHSEDSNGIPYIVIELHKKLKKGII